MAAKNHTSIAILKQFEAELALATEQQRKKVLELARHLMPNLTPEDILNPHDFPKLMQNKDFQFEDGITTGMVGVLTMLRRFIKDCEL